MKPTEAELKWLAKIVNSDDVELGINDDGPYLRLKTDDEETVKRFARITEKIIVSQVGYHTMGVEEELTFNPSEER